VWLAMAVGESPTGATSGTAGVPGPADKSSTAEPQPNETTDTTSPSASLKVLGAVGGQITLLTFLLFYFGWARTAAEAQYLGFDASALQLSTSDYVLRSVDTLFLPLFLLAAALIGVQIVHPHIVSWCYNLTKRHVCRLRIAILLILVMFPLAGWVATRPALQWWPLVMPLSVTSAILLCLYIALLARVLRQRGSALSTDAALQRATAQKHEPQPLWPMLRGTWAIALVVLCLFWTIGRFANMIGDSAAAKFVSSIQHQDAITVTVVSKYDLTPISAPLLRPQS